MRVCVCERERESRLFTFLRGFLQTEHAPQNGATMSTSTSTGIKHDFVSTRGAATYLWCMSCPCPRFEPSFVPLFSTFFQALKG